LRDYAGELTLDEAWQILADEDNAVLIDVRTRAEWNFVGVPVLEGVGKRPRMVEWTTYPDGAPNPDFVEQASKDLDPATPVLLLCRSGERSRGAAQALAASGFERAYNITLGFEGDLNKLGHRTTGWRYAGLPWKQG